VIVSGLFSKEADFGALTLKSAGATDAFVARYDADGKVQWVSQVSSPGSAWAWRVSSDGSGGAVLTGKHSGQATLGGLSLPGHGADDFFTAHVDAQGSFSWASGAGWYGNQGGWGVAAVGQGGAIATGRFEWTVNFGPVTLAAAGDDDIFIVKYGPGGKVQWARSAGGNSQDWGWDVAADGTGGALLAGHFNGLAQFDQSTVDAKGGADVFVARYSAAGKLLWVQSAGGPKLDRAYGVARDGSGALVTGYFADQALFGGHQLTAQGETDLFVARLDSAGSWDWALAAGGAGHERPAGLALGPGHTLYVAGDFTKTTRLGTQALTAKGQEDVFVWKLPLP
jgi:hypothetical protein